MLYPKKWIAYELLDAGNFRKLERFGKVLTDRPEPSANWPKALSKEKWMSADLYFHEEKGQKGKWKSKTEVDNWILQYALDEATTIKLKLEKTAFKHLGVFPEQAINWEYIYKHCKSLNQIAQPQVLNLFAYTGGSSIAAALAGAKVTHVDSVKQVVQWANINAELNQLDNIRWIVEDAKKFVTKSIKRGDKYQGIIMDPPSFGFGSKGSVWKLEKDLGDLLAGVLQLLDSKNAFFVMNTYSPNLDHLKLRKLLLDTYGFPKFYEMRELGIKSSSNKMLPLGNLVRFYI